MSLQIYSATQILRPDSQALLEEIILLISHAFTDDPGNRWLFNDHTRSQYIQQLPHFTRFLLMLALNAGANVTVIRDSNPITKRVSRNEAKTAEQLQIQLPQNATIKSLGVLIPPAGNAKFESAMNTVRSGLLTLPWYCGFGVLYKMMFNQVPAMMDMQKRMWPAPNSHKRHELWHLLILATHPDAQGQGLGKKILLEFQRIARESGPEEKGGPMPLYLESSSLGSKRLYERVGFEQRGEMTYGECRPNQAVNVDENDRIIGGRWYGMVWTP